MIKACLIELVNELLDRFLVVFGHKMRNKGIHFHAYDGGTQLCQSDPLLEVSDAVSPAPAWLRTIAAAPNMVDPLLVKSSAMSTCVERAQVRTVTKS